jgi:nucleoside-triphosphatase THEP1
MQTLAAQNSLRLQSLIALWAISETAIGGFLHAFKLPITGFIVGGFAVIIISLLGYYAENKWTTILKATALVIIIKGMISPQSPPTAYIAVLFQGMLGALLFSTCKYKPAVFLFAILAMLESGLQKLLVISLVFGRQFWSAIDQVGQELLSKLGFNQVLSLSLATVLIYLFLHVVWAFILYRWMMKVPLALEQNRKQFEIKKSLTDASETTKPKKYRKWVLLASLCIVYALLIGYVDHQTSKPFIAFEALIRSVLMLSLLIYVVGPLFSMAIKYWIKTATPRYAQDLQQILTLMPNINRQMSSKWLHAQMTQKGWRRYRAFVMDMLTAAIHPETKSNIVIYTGPIDTGKTSQLANYLSKMKDVKGFLCPKTNGMRMIYNIKQGTTSPFECSSNSTEPYLNVGRFCLLKSGFDTGRQILESFATAQAGTFVIDEIGKLELQGLGFEPALSKCISAFKLRSDESQMILVVRDTLVAEVIKKYE